MYSGRALWKTVARVLAVLSVAITLWSLNVAWGDDPALRGGPPRQWERHLVGAALLAGLSAVLVLFGSRPGAALVLRSINVAISLGPGVIALVLRSEAAEKNLPQLLEGPGWTWLAVGSGLAVLAAASTFLSQKSPERKRARGRSGR